MQSFIKELIDLCKSIKNVTYDVDRSRGNADDVFSDGVDTGESYTARQVEDILRKHAYLQDEE